MKKLIVLLLIVASCYGAMVSIIPSYDSDKDSDIANFSTDRALQHVKEISKIPHGVGFKGHKMVREYIVAELQKMGLETSLQEGYTAGDWANLCYATNVLAKIKGKNKGKSLVLLSHYDSSPHSSLGASDAGSGVATILEGIRAFLSENKTPENDIIILLTDAEELGLNGADLFVNQHPWAKNLGLVLNFEARGSGGPSYMLIETNGGNKRLIEEFTKAKPEYPVANSLAYSVYKMLPNDTDLTVFREDGDIEGFNFAFIDDHFDYHTAHDNYERLDKKTLAHQGSYLMPLLNHFAITDITTLKSNADNIYFTVPIFKMVSYPYQWIWPIFVFAVIFFVILIYTGVKSGVLNGSQMLKGFVPLVLAIVLSGTIGYFGWPLLNWVYPQYQDILHGFTYNGYWYIAAFVALSLFISFYCFSVFKKITAPNILVAPIFLWLLISGAVAVYLKGASFIIIPVFGLLISLLILINQKKPNLFLLWFLALPAICIFVPLIKMFPVGLGLKMLVTASALTVLTFALLLPLFGFYKREKLLAVVSGFIFLICIIAAHFNSGFSEENAKPSSLMYVFDADTKTAKWATYDNYVTNWTAQYIGEKGNAPENATETISSKYNSRFSYVADAPLKEIKAPLIEKTADTVINGKRHLKICITPKRNVNRLDLFTNKIQVEKAKVNGVSLKDEFLQNRRSKLLTHFITNNAYTEIELVLQPNTPLELTLYEAANDLLSNPKFSVPPRPKHEIPMPFVINDAVMVTKTIQF